METGLGTYLSVIFNTVRMLRKKLFLLGGGFLSIGLFLFLGAFVRTAGATHSWGNYHWARTAKPFALKLGDNVSSVWDAYLTTTSNDWSVSTVLDTTVVAGANLKNCKPVNGRVEVCNNRYGNNGWLGIASIWASGDHITQGTVKLNDTYFNRAPYNTSPWRNFVMCQEVGHTLGLDHQDEIFGNPNLGTCMDYTSDPDGKLYSQLDNQHPNTHDYDQLATIYTHLDTITTLSNRIIGSSARAGNNDNNNIDTANSREWGKEVRKDKKGRGDFYKRDLGKGDQLFTFVVWAD